MMSGCWTPRQAKGAGRGFGLAAAAIVLASFLAVGCHQTAPPKMNKVVEVVVTEPVMDEVTDYEDFTGRLDALKTVDIRPRVSGYITEAPFVEGDIVKEGDTLFQIDPAPYDADLAQAKANLKQAEAEEVLQTRRAERGKRLLGTAAIGPEDYDQLIAARDKAIANVGAMKAALARAELNRKWTTVKVPPLHDDAGRPLSGRISRRLVDPGNLVNADQTILTTLVSIDPVYAYFDVDERTYLKLASLTEQGSNSWFSALQFPVLMRLANEEDFHQKGSVNFLDNRLNANTGTVRMRGVFANPSGVLKSGLFVRIRLPVGISYMAVMVPDEALQSDQGRKYVYVVKKGKNETGEEVDQVEYRAVDLGQSIKGLRVIKPYKETTNEKGEVVKTGLKPDEKVVTSGMQRVRPGSMVKVTTQDPPAPPKSPLTQILKESTTTKPAPQPVSSAGKGSKGEGAVAAPSLKDMPRLDSGHAHREGKGQR